VPGDPDRAALQAKDVVAVLEELTRLYPAPAVIRSDNGQEFIAKHSGAGARTAVRAGPTSRQDQLGRTAFSSHSTVASAMSS